MAGKTSTAAATRGAYEALVRKVEDGGLRVRKVGGAARDTTARVAVRGYRPTVGDRVLVLEGSEGGWVVGVVHAPVEDRTVRTESGASATVEGDSLVLRDHAGSIVAVFDASTGQTTLRASGDLHLAAGRNVMISGEVIELDAREKTALRAPRLDLTADDASLHAKHASVNAETTSIASTTITALAGKLELRVQRIVEHAVDVYREIEGMDQTRAGRVRTVVAGAFRLLAGRSEVVSKEDTVIDGKRVLLG